MRKLLVLSGFIVSLLLVQVAHATNLDQCNANNPTNCPEPTQICNNGNHTGNPHCNDVTPTIPVISPTLPIPCDEKCEVTPTVVVSPTASPSATPSPTDSPIGDKEGDHRSDGLSSCPECTKTPEPTLIPNVGWK